MSVSYPPQADAPTPQPAYYAIIPASVRYHPSLPPAAKLLFGEITALCSVQGYCWAQNPYFIALYGVDRSTVKRWLSALAAAGFITVEYNRQTGERRIYLRETVPSETIKNEVAQKCATPGAEMRHPRRRNAPQSITENIKLNKTKTLTLPQPSQNLVAINAEPADFLGEKVSLEATLRNADEDVAAAVALTSDEGSSARFKQIWHIASRAQALESWDEAYNATKKALNAPERRVGRAGAYFHAVLVKCLSDRNVTVAVGTRKEREEVRRIIQESFATAGST
jgi:DNA-binding MarR family transcriptional regulator